MKKLPIVLFITVLGLVCFAYAGRLWLLQLGSELEDEIARLQQQEEDYRVQIEALGRELKRPKTVSESRILKIKDVPKCSMQGVKLTCEEAWISVAIPSTRVEGTVIDPDVRDQLEKTERELLGHEDQLEATIRKAELVARAAYFPSINFQQLISLIFVAAALYILLSKKYESESEKWAMGALGTILGYWLGG